MKRVTKLEVLEPLTKRTKVAAYARVSSGKDAMLQSLASQVNHYKKLIQDNPKWIFSGVYADEALTGTKDDRKEFQQLLRDCRDGKVDMIITKSISRFARNTVTLLETVRELKSLNIDIYFEEQNIHTLSGEGEMILTFLASFAQEESRSVSENMKWRIKRDFEEGILWGGNSFYGYKLEGKTFILIPDEAETVKLIFDLYEKGFGAESIIKVLDEKGILPKYSKMWNRSSIITMLSNPNYTGDLVLQKTYRDHHLTKRKKMNQGEQDQYIVSHHHEAIITKKQFDVVQAIRMIRSEKYQKYHVKKHQAFIGKIRCGICGSSYTYKTTPYHDI